MSGFHLVLMHTQKAFYIDQTSFQAVSFVILPVTQCKLAKLVILSKQASKRTNECVLTVTFKQGRPTVTCTVQCPFGVRAMEMSTMEVSEPRKYQRNKTGSDVRKPMKTTDDLSSTPTVHRAGGQNTESALN